MIKKEFLVTDFSGISRYLHKNSTSCTLYKYKDKNSYKYDFDEYTFVLEEYKTFNKLILISRDEVVLDEKILNLQEVSDDRRYSKEYIKLFGNPKDYEFDEKKVFQRCDEVGLSKLNLHFKMGMECSKVFRVILYRLNQLFLLEYAQYMKKKISYDELENRHKQLLEGVKLSKKVFYKNIIKKILEDLEDIYMLLNDQETFDRYVLNFQMFIHEKNFYNKKDVDEPIYFFEKKEELLGLL